ncbi:PLP-dependent cysteine synthase family protein [Clostridium pasteurianum]|uniref:cysteine synthase n=1 Tax=Clostridium pasteurianum BC1 TaxID=86416 RepID=R4K0Q7_CLOPA|nr:PLP-dependent cysteine synthase family protein [Clostridium pasteurianum]AGK96672.1 cysteine synthase [Clostridium pasteurianum BC1]
MIVSSILDVIGNTPIVKLSHLSPLGKADVYAKAEFLNPMGSVKDRPALAMVNAAEKDNKLHHGMTIVEATSGNTGVGLTMVSVIKNYKVIIIMEEIDIVESICKIVKTLGAEVIRTNSFESAVKLAETFQQENPEKYYVPHQFKNIANPQIHTETTAQEIIKDVGPRIKAFVSTFGSGGTFTGIGRALKKYNPNIELVLIEPDTVPIFSGGRITCSEIHGVGPTFVSDIFDRSLIDTIVQVSAQQAREASLNMARTEGILCGPSAGASVYVAAKVAERYSSNDIVVTILPDRGERYFGENVF